jgi:hypothetical protein
LDEFDDSEERVRSEGKIGLSTNRGSFEKILEIFGKFLKKSPEKSSDIFGKLIDLLLVVDSSVNFLSFHPKTEVFLKHIEPGDFANHRQIEKWSFFLSLYQQLLLPGSISSGSSVNTLGVRFLFSTALPFDP